MFNQAFGQYLISCPNCKRLVKFSLAWFGLFPMRSGLGPAEFICARCETVYESGLREWQQMGTGRKLNFGFHSLCYALIGGFFSAGMLILIDAAIRAPNVPFMETLDTRKLLIVWGCITGIVLLIQAMRVNLSLERMLTEAKPYRATYTDWQINLQAWVMKIWIAVFIGGYLLGKALAG
jgi:hypothetical protein